MAYVTPDDFFNFYGRDLRELLRSDNNDSTQAERFIEMVTIHLKNFIDANTFRRLDYDRLTEYQNKQWKYAILAQCYYTYKEGSKALGLFSGVDDEKGIIIDYGTIREIEICPAAIDFLSNAGLFNLVIKNRPRVWMDGIFGIYNDSIPSVPFPPSPPPIPPTPSYAYTLGVGYTDMTTQENHNNIAYTEVK